jgi:hypothetical protein
MDGRKMEHEEQMESIQKKCKKQLVIKLVSQQVETSLQLYIKIQVHEVSSASFKVPKQLWNWLN